MFLIPLCRRLLSTSASPPVGFVQTRRRYSFDFFLHSGKLLFIPVRAEAARPVLSAGSLTAFNQSARPLETAIAVFQGASPPRPASPLCRGRLVAAETGAAAHWSRDGEVFLGNRTDAKLRSTQRRRRPRPLYVLYRTVREIQIFSRIYFLQSEAFPFVGKEDEITFGNQWQETDIQCFDWITFGVLEVTTIPTETRLV